MNKSVSGLFDLVPTSCTVLRAFIKDIAPSFFTGWPDSREPALQLCQFQGCINNSSPEEVPSQNLVTTVVVCSIV